MDVIKEKLKLLPDSPGVYIMLDKYGNVIYVGKARVLKNRVRQYFHNTPKPQKVMQMVANIADFNYIITNSEIDALALENNLIKKYKPKYNILLKDDKTYPYIKADMRDRFPSFYITRKIKKDGGRYFGPFMGGINCKDILEVVQLLFGVRLCHTSVTAKPKRECLNYHIGRCTAPCAHKINEEEYGLRVKKALNFLDGDYKNAQAVLEQKMIAAAEGEAFELALDYRNKISMLSKLEAKRITSINKAIDADIIAYATNNLYSAVNVLVTRKGIMQGASSFALDEAHISDAEALTSFITQYYATHEPPAEIVVPEYCEKLLVSQFFKEKLGKSVDITAAKQGVKAELLKMAERNAHDYLEKSVDKIRHRDDMTVNACKRLQQMLGLVRYPRRMECYDISNVSGVDKVASMVVFIDGEADRTQYRRFKIKTVEGANDFASLQEVLLRIRVLLKRNEIMNKDNSLSDEITKIGDIEILPDTLEAVIINKKVKLTPTEFEILYCLMQHFNNPVTLATLLDDVWGYDSNEDVRMLRVHVGGLRNKIEADTKKPKYLHTVTNVGYKLTPFGEA